jgi:hypothetical protein
MHRARNLKETSALRKKRDRRFRKALEIDANLFENTYQRFIELWIISNDDLDRHHD